MAPRGWNWGRLGDGIVLISGQHVNAGDCTNDTSHTPYITGPSDLIDGQILVTKHTPRPKVLCGSGDILLTVKGSGTGTVFRADSQYCISRQLMAIRPRTWHPGFVYHVLVFSAPGYARAAAGLIPGIGRRELLNTRILLPSHAEQSAIAQLLFTWDRAIEQITRLIKAKRRLRSALLRFLISGECRLFCHEGLPLKEMRITEIAEINPPGRPTESISPYIDMASVAEGFSGLLSIRFRPTPSSGSAFRDGDIIFARITPCAENGKVAIVEGLGEGIIGHGSTEFIVLRARTPLVLSKYLFYLCCSDQVHGYAVAHMEGTSGRQRIPASIFRHISVPVPSLKTQGFVVEILDLIAKDTALLTRMHTCLSDQKQALMQKLLTGKIRVKIPKEA